MTDYAPWSEFAVRRISETTERNNYLQGLNQITKNFQSYSWSVAEIPISALHAIAALQ
jgi:hypothetical protein